MIIALETKTINPEDNLKFMSFVYDSKQRYETNPFVKMLFSKWNFYTYIKDDTTHLIQDITINVPQLQWFGAIWLFVCFLFYFPWWSYLPGVLMIGSIIFYDPVFYITLFKIGIKKYGYKNKVKSLSLKDLLKRVLEDESSNAFRLV